MRWIRAVAVVATFLGVGVARAAPRPEVAVVGLHVANLDDAAAADAADRLAKALDATGKVDAVTAADVRARISGREPIILDGIFLGPGRTSLSEGRVLYERADFEDAIPALDLAVAQLQDGLAGATDSKDLLDALLLLGLAHASIGEQQQAKDIFTRAVVLDPSRQLDSVNYPPKMVALYSQVRSEILGQAAAQLIVQSTETGAHVYVDGRDQGVAPATVDGLPPGSHYVLVIGQGGKRSFSQHDIAAGEHRTYQAHLSARSLARPAETPTERSRQIRQLYTSLGSHLSTAIIALGGELPDGQVTIQLYEPRTGNFSQQITAPAGADPVKTILSLAPAITGYITSEGTLASSLVSTNVAPLDIDTNGVLGSLLLDPKPIVASGGASKGPPWYVWGGIGAIAAGGAVGAVVLLSSNNTSNTEDPDQGTIKVAIP